MNPSQAQALLRELFSAAVRAAQAEHCMPPFLREPPKGRTVVIGAGKAAAAMAQTLERHWLGPLEGLVVTRYGHAVPCTRIEVREAAHPVPDSAGASAAQAILARLRGLQADDMVISLISGGGSALLSMPSPGLTMADKQHITSALLKSGATITEINCVRRHLSAIKGGRLALACAPARVVNLLISDVPGDEPYQIASGPTVADPTTCQDALNIVQRYCIVLPEAARLQLQSGAAETVKPGDSRLPLITTHVIATPHMALQAAAHVARRAGIAAPILGDSLEGEAREVGRLMAGMARHIVQHGQPVPRPCVLLSGGETTVTVRGSGRGGRNVEFLLALALGLDQAPGVYAIAGDTDGVDGLEAIAGAMVSPSTLARAQALGLDARQFLGNNDGHGFFAALGDSLITGPTLTNVNDFRAILMV